MIGWIVAASTLTGIVVKLLLRSFEVLLAFVCLWGLGLSVISSAVSALGYGGMFHCMMDVLLVAGLDVGFTGLGDRGEA